MDAPSIEFSSKRGKFGFLEVFWQGKTGEPLFVVDRETLAMRQPTDNVLVLFVVEHLHEPLRDCGNDKSKVRY